MKKDFLSVLSSVCSSVVQLGYQKFSYQFIVPIHRVIYKIMKKLRPPGGYPSNHDNEFVCRCTRFINSI